MKAEKAVEMLRNNFQDEYSEIDGVAFLMAIDSLEKQVPKKIFHHPWNGIDGVPYDLCPNCKTNLCTTGLFASKKENYCGNCGQKLDWGTTDV